MSGQEMRRVRVIIKTMSGRIAFQFPNFRYYMIARFLITSATEMQAVAVGWQVYALTNRPMDLGLVGLAQFLPGIFLFLVAGHTADRLPRLRILQACYVGFALCSATLLGLTSRGLTAAWPIYAVLLANGVVRAFNGPAGQAFLPLLVPEEHFQNAVAWASSVFMSATILGPTIGGLMYGLTGNPMPVYGCSATFTLVGLVLISRLRIPRVVRARQAATVEVVLGGLHYIWRNKVILGSISLDLFAVLLGGAVALLPVYAKNILHVGSAGLGLLRGGPGVGALITSIAVAHWPLRRHAGTAMLWCVAGFGIFTVVFGLSRNVALSMAALVLVGACDMVSVIVRHTLVQLHTPDDMRGRVSAVNMLFVGASNELGQFESGVTGQWFGPVAAVVLGGVGTMVIVGLWSWMFPGLRKIDKV
jgi:MFS family permease